jgi:hypothetical protein
MMSTQARARILPACEWVLPRCRARRWVAAARALVRPLSCAKSMSASRSSFSQVNRKVTAWCPPDCRVDGVVPASQARLSAVGERCRQSPISPSKARRDPARPGQAGEDVATGMERRLLDDARLERVGLVADRPTPRDSPWPSSGERGWRWSGGHRVHRRSAADDTRMVHR